MIARSALILICVSAPALAEADAVAQCLSCHIVGDQLDIVGITALKQLPEAWPMLFEDAFDRDNDGIAGRVQFVSGADGPLIGKWGRSLAAARLEDFASIAGAAHDIPIDDQLDEILKTFERLSPAPPNPFASQSDLRLFEGNGCADCHVTQTYEVDGMPVMPLSDFLLHDLGDGDVRTTPLWVCDAACLAFRHE
ncbi:MAG: hypothetical protein AAFQ64_15380 [Pseudomonadota bacterium]